MRTLSLEEEKSVFQGHIVKCWLNQYNGQGLLTPSAVVFDCLLFSQAEKVEMGGVKKTPAHVPHKFIQLPRSPDRTGVLFGDNSVIYIRHGKNL